MEEREYAGIRLMLEGSFGNLRQTIKIDVSTGDAITPDAIEYVYSPMFSDYSFPLRAYNTETLLAEKLETIMARGTVNTRTRDFYDVYMIGIQKDINIDLLKRAFLSTCEKRNTLGLISDLTRILNDIYSSISMKKQWESFQKGSLYAENMSWDMIMERITNLAEKLIDSAS